jgi:hypothetical protein
MMAPHSDLFALLMDPARNLSPEARVLLLHVTDMGPGVHEIAYSTLMRLLQIRDPKKLRRVLTECEDAHWLKVDRRGNNGRHPRFELRVPESTTLTQGRVPENPPLRASSVPDFGTLPSRKKEKEEEGSARARDGMDLAPLAPDAEALIEAEAELLGHARKPLVSYLRRRVALDKQEPYVGTALGWLRGMGFNWRDATGSSIPMERWAEYLAVALNELATAEEKSRKWAQGDTANLYNKLLNVCQRENAPAFQRTGTDNRREREYRVGFELPADGGLDPMKMELMQ